MDFWVITGPTAGGKTALAMALARRRPLEIISADSMQVYADLPLATAAPTEEERRAVPHHLVGMLAADDKYSAARFLGAARTAAAAAAARGHRVLVVGGTGLYIEVMRRGLFEHPDIAPEVRRTLDTRLAAEGVAPLYAELRGVDPVAAARIHPNDSVRVRRFLEVYLATGRPISALWSEETATPGVDEAGWNCRATLVLAPPRDLLYARIDARATAMVRAGLLGELDRLRRACPPSALDDALRPLGVRDLVAALERGEVGPEMSADDPALAPHLEAMRQSTRRYAKRQLTWLRKHSPPSATCRWIDPTEGDVGGAVAAAEAFFGW